MSDAEEPLTATEACQPHDCRIHTQSDPATIVRGIAEDIVRESRQDRFSNVLVWRDHLEKWIATVLREYGEERSREALLKFCEGEDCKLAEFERKADAEGYRRGVEETKAKLDLCYDGQPHFYGEHDSDCERCGC